MKLVLPLPPNVTNTRGHGASTHWRSRQQARRRYAAYCDALRMARKIPGPPAAPYPRVRIAAHLYLWAWMDDDNAMARMKIPLDWLVRAGYIENDTRRHIAWAGLPEQTIDRKARRLEITLEPAAAGGEG